MRGYRNLSIAMAGLAATTFVAYAGIQYGTDPIGLATVVGAIWTGVVGVVFGRGYNKGKEALNGGIQ